MTWRVGVLFSQTGVTAAIERSQLNATLLAVDEINKAGGVLGRPIEPNIYDPASNPKQFRALAERLLTADRVRLIFGCYMSSTRKAVLPVVEAFRGLLFYPNIPCIASIREPRPIKIPCNWPSICCNTTGTAFC
jgi:branched-chain amino acid transport system substrate-binding protein